MKFSVLIAIVPENMEQVCIDKARELGAGGITLLQGRGISNETRKTFFGLSYDGSQSILLMVLEKGMSLDIIKALQQLLHSTDSESQGLAFAVPIEHIGGIDLAQVAKFEDHLKESM